MKKFSTRNFLATVFYTLLAFLWIVPVIWLVGKAFTPEMAIYKEGHKLIPSQLTVNVIS